MAENTIHSFIQLVIMINSYVVCYIEQVYKVIIACLKITHMQLIQLTFDDEAWIVCVISL